MPLPLRLPRPRALIALLLLAGAHLTAQPVTTDSFPRPDRPVSRIVAPRWIALYDPMPAVVAHDTVMEFPDRQDS